MRKNTVEDIFARCVKDSKGCLVWTGGTVSSSSSGLMRYPTISIAGKKGRGNRIILQEKLGAPLGKLHALHTCDNTLCLNPEHLYAGSNLQNVKDKIERRRHAMHNVTHCKRGHPFIGRNLVMRGSRRRCRKCEVIRATESQIRRGLRD